MPSALPDRPGPPAPAVALSLAGPPPPGKRARRLRAAAAILTAWTAYGLVHAAYWISTTTAPAPWSTLLGIALVMAWTWAALTPGLFALARYADPARIGWPRSIALHTAALVGVALVMGTLRLLLILATTASESGGARLAFEPGLLWPRVVFWADVNFFTYVAVILTGRAMASHRRYLDRTLRTHVLETQLARAQLHFLELQLQPHFLFNSLNVIQELAHEAPNAAERMLRRLQALLARSLERSGQDEHTLGEELAALEPYLDIQRTRFEWLAVGIHVNADTRNAMVPHLILQPLVENAIRHGLAVRQAPGHIEVFAERRGDRLVMQVRDDGVGLQAASLDSRSGIGLRNANERLRQLYGKDHRFELRPREHGGVVVEIDIPFHERPPGTPTPSWTELPRTRESMPEVSVEDVSAWRTGEFAAALAPVPSPTPLGPTDKLRHPPRDPEREAIESEPLIAAVEQGHEPSAPLFTARTWLILVAIWLGTATLWTFQMHGFIWLSDGMGAGWDWMIVRLQFAGAMYWTAASLGIFALARTFRLYGSHTARNMALHFGAAVTISFGFLWVLQSVGLSTTPILNEFNINPLTGNFFLYFGLLAWSHSRDFAAWYRARELASARLTSEIARSRFQALCVQVRPQFVLGTLDLLARLVHMDVPRADRLIARFADVLRLTLDTAAQRDTILAEEMRLVAASVEAHRLGIRPGVALEVDLPSETLTTHMPARLLTTLVDDLLATTPDGQSGAVPPLLIRVRAERVLDTTRIRVHGESMGQAADAGPHDWWRRKSAAEAAVQDAGPLVTVAFPDRATAVVIVADNPPAAPSEFVAA